MSLLGSIHIERFKSLFDINVEPGLVNVFIGANGSGKSNLLESLGVISAAAAGRIDDQALLRRGVRPGVPRIYKSAFPSEKKDPSIRIHVKSRDENLEYRIGISNQSNTPKPFWHFQQEAIVEGGTTIAFRNPGSASIHGEKISKTRDERSASLSLQVKSHSKTSNNMHAFLQQLDDYGIFSPVTPVLRGIAADSAPRSPVGLYGGGLPEAVDSLSSEPKRRFKEVALSLIDWAKNYSVGQPSRNFIASSVPTMRSVIRFSDQFMRKSDQTLSGYDASEGALYILYLMVLAAHPQSPRIFSIDNFDQALNPAAARSLMKAFAKEILTQERQVFMTTHNPLVLDGLPLEDERVRLFTVSRNQKGHSIIKQVPVKNIAALKESHGSFAISRLWIEGRLGGMPRVGKI